MYKKKTSYIQTFADFLYKSFNYRNLIFITILLEFYIIKIKLKLIKV